jgi:hypothetical protein
MMEATAKDFMVICAFDGILNRRSEGTGILRVGDLESDSGVLVSSRSRLALYKTMGRIDLCLATVRGQRDPRLRPPRSS